MVLRRARAPSERAVAWPSCKPATTSRPPSKPTSWGANRRNAGRVDTFGALVYTYCRRTAPPEMVDDIVQEVFVAAWRNRQRFDPAVGPPRRVAGRDHEAQGRRCAAPPSPHAADRGDHADAATVDGVDAIADRMLAAHALACPNGTAGHRVGLPVGPDPCRHREAVRPATRDREERHPPGFGTHSSVHGSARCRDRLIARTGPEPRSTPRPPRPSCRRCARSTDDDRTLVRPPPEIWDRIRGELDADETTPVRPGRTEPSVQDGRRRRGRVLAAMLAAAAVLVVVVAAAVIAVVTRLDDEVVARTNLETIDSGEVVGTAELVDRDGSQRLWVDVPDAAAAESGFLELWLISDDVERLVSLGPVAPGRTRLRCRRVSTSVSSRSSTFPSSRSTAIRAIRETRSHAAGSRADAPRLIARLSTAVARPVAPGFAAATQDSERVSGCSAGSRRTAGSPRVRRR